MLSAGGSLLGRIGNMGAARLRERRASDLTTTWSWSRDGGAKAILDGVDEAELQSHAKLLSEVVEIFSVLVDPRVEPAPGSAADRELSATQELPAKQGTWGDGPLQLAYGTALIYYQAALEQVGAVAQLMSGEYSAVPAGVLARAVAETASQAWWLLEPDIGGKRRVQRLQALRFRSACEGEKAANADGSTADQYGWYIETIDAVMRYSRALGLEDPGRDGRVYFCGKERLMTPSRRVPAMFAEVDIPSVYHLQSGYPHGELFALRQGFELSDEGGCLPYVRPIQSAEAFKATVAVASYSLYPPGYRLSTLYGLDRPTPPRPG